MITLGVVVSHKLADRVAKRCLSEKDHSAQTFFLYRAHEPLGESVQVR